MSILFAILLALFPACPTEDSTYCGWAAPDSGNGQGRSFIALGEGVTLWLS